MGQIQSVIVSGLLKDFRLQFGLESLSESDAFERFVNYLTVSKYLPEALDDTSRIEDITLDDGQNFGVDGMAIIVNNNLVTAIEELEVYKKSRHLDVHFVFIQAKTSASYDSGDILKFVQSVKNFFSSTPSIDLNEDLAHFQSIKNSLFEYQNAKFFSGGSPNCSLVYATTSINEPSEMINAVITTGESEIQSNFVDLKNVRIIAVGSDYLINAIREVENSFEVVVNFKNSVALEKMNDVEQAYIGYMNVKDMLRLISDQDGNLRKNLFYENVRDFQGLDNSVNKGMDETLKTSQLRDKFVLFNNGITVVTKHLKVLGGSDIELRDFQIVNGCQTSNILFRNRQLIENSVDFALQVKVIHTNANELISHIIKATNQQSPIPNEAFLALEEFHKELQMFYAQMAKLAPAEVFYERRSREYSNSEPPIEKIRIINLHAQIRCFASMFLGKPQDHHFRSPSTIYREYSNLMFRDSQSFYPYYVSAYANYRLHQLANDGNIRRFQARFRYHVLLAFRVLVVGPSLPKFNSKDMDAVGKKMCEVLWDDGKSIELFEQAWNVVLELKHELISGFGWSRLIKSDIFTQSIIKKASKVEPQKPSSPKTGSGFVVRKLIPKSEVHE